jgi:hypothetical protein
MKWLWRLALGATLLLLAAGALMALGGWWLLNQDWLTPGAAVVHIDGESFELAELGAGSALAIVGAIVAVLLVTALVVPGALLIAFIATALGVALALAAVLGVFALLLAPLALPVLLGWWLLRRARGAPPRSA